MPYIFRDTPSPPVIVMALTSKEVERLLFVAWMYEKGIVKS